MEYRSLGRTGVKVSELCLGCWMFGRRTEAQDAYAMVDQAVDAGVNFVDTANVYSRGKSEEMLGEALKRNKKRSRVVLATKVHGNMDDEDPNSRGNSRRHIIEQCEANLRRLQTDYIDLYQIHYPMPDIPIDETLRALDDLIHLGKVRYIGCSTFSAWAILESLWVSKELGLNRFVCDQPPYNLMDRRIEREVIPMAQTYGLAIIPWSPLAGGFLTGKYKRSQAAPEGSRYSKGAIMENSWEKRSLTDRAYDVVEALEPMAKEKGCSMSQLVLAWVAAQPGITSPIIGPRTVEQLVDNLGSVDIEITDDDQARIDGIVPPGRMIMPYPRGGKDEVGKPHPYRW